MIAPLDHWASAGVAPQSITASKSANGVVIARVRCVPIRRKRTGRELAAPMKRLILCAQCRSTDGKAHEFERKALTSASQLASITSSETPTVDQLLVPSEPFDQPTRTLAGGAFARIENANLVISQAHVTDLRIERRDAFAQADIEGIDGAIACGRRRMLAVFSLHAHAGGVGRIRAFRADDNLITLDIEERLSRMQCFEHEQFEVSIGCFES